MDDTPIEHSYQAELTGTEDLPQCPYFSQGDHMTKAEQEVQISKCANETHWTIYSTDPRWTRFFRALGDKVGGREFQHQGGTKFLLPANELRFAAKRRLHLSDAEKARRRERLQATTAPVAVAD
jgi:hypothetical protein